MQHDELKRIKAHRKRRCPHCDSDNWRWLGAVSTTREELTHYLLVRYRCKRCRAEFLVEEAKGARYVSTASRCVFCNSRSVEKTSGPDADIELWRCRQCNGYMAIGEPDHFA